MFNKGLIWSSDDVRQLYAEAGYPGNTPQFVQRIHAGGVGLGNASLAASSSFDYYGSYFFRGGGALASNFITTDPETAGQNMPYFFGQSRLVVRVSAITLPARVVITEVCFSSYYYNSGLMTVSHIDSSNLVEGDVIELDSKGDCTRYWTINGITGVAGALTIQVDSFWSGFGGIERQS